MWRRLLGVGLAVVALVGSAVAALHAPPTGRFVARHLVRLVFAQTGQDLTVGELALELLPPAVVLYDVALRQDGAAAPALACRRLRLRPHPWPSPTGALVIGEAEVDGLRVDQRVAAVGRPQPRGPPQALTLPRLPIDVREVRVTDGAAVLRVGPSTLALHGIRLLTHVTAVHGREVDLEVAGGSLLWPEGFGPWPLPLRLRASGNLTGTLHRPQALHLAAGEAALGDATLAVAGDLDLAHALTANLDLQLAGALAAVGGLVPALSTWDGQVTLEAHLTGTSLSPRLVVDAFGGGLTVAGRPVGDLRLSADIDRQRVNLASARLEQAGAGAVTGSGRMLLAPTLPLRASLRLHDAALPQALEAFGIAGPWIRLRASGDVELDGGLAPAQVGVRAELAVSDFAALDAPYRAPRAKALWALATGQVRGSAVLGAHGATLREVHLFSGRSQATVRGTLGYGQDARLALEAQSELVDLAEMGPLAGIAWTGHGPVQARVAGRMERPTIAAVATMAEVSIDGLPVGSGSAELDFDWPRLTIRELLLARGEGAIAGDGQLDFAGDAVACAAALEIRRLGAGDVLDTVGVPPTLAAHLGGPTNGRVRLHGPCALPRGTLHLTAAALAVDGVAFGPMVLDGAFGAPHEPFSGSLHLTPAGGHLDVDAALADDGAVSLRARGGHLPLPLLAPLLGDASMTGSLSGTLALRGPLAALDGEAVLTAEDLGAYGVRLEAAKFYAEARAGAARVQGTLLGGAVTMAAQMTLHRTLPFAVEARFAHLDTARLRDLPADLSAQVSGTARARGTLAGDAPLTAEVDLADAELRWRTLSLRLPDGAHLTYGTNGLHLAETTLVGGRLRLTVGGQLQDGAAPLDVRLSGEGDLGPLAEALAPVSAASLPFALRLTVGGSYAEPVVLGAGRVTGGSMRLGGGEEPFEDVAFALSASGTRVRLVGGEGRLGRGSVALEGEMNLDPDLGDDGARLSLRAHLEHAELRPVPDAEAELTGDLALNGRTGELALTGQLRVDGLHYAAHLAFDRLLSRSAGSPLRAPGARGSPVKLAVRLRAANNVIIASNVLDAELAGDVTVTGNTERMGLLGMVTPLWARARYRDNTFEVLRASIDFTDEYRISPEYQIQARTEACRMTADVTIQGNAEHTQVTATGQDTHGVVDSQDVLACLQFGLRLHDFAGNQQAPAGLGDALPGSLDALWTVSGLDTKVKRLLPIDLDEVRLTSGFSQLSLRNTARVQVGKEIGRNLAVRYSRSLDEFNDQSFSLEYRLSERATMQGSWVSVRDVPVGDFGVDLRLHWERP